MFSYLHKYHAGNFADVHKHIALIALIEYLKQKEKPFAVLDAFAGEGIYDLQSKEAQLNKEHKEGIEALLKGPRDHPLLQSYVHLVKSYNPVGEGPLQDYPGSPALIADLLREQDRGIFVENHPASFEALKSNFGKVKALKLHQRDAFEAIHALLPLSEKRGLVFIDPSYEVKSDYLTLAKALEKAFDKMSHAVFAIWYPILPEAHHKTLLRALHQGPFPNLYLGEWRPYPDKSKGLIGSGIVILNKGWQIDTQLSQVFNYLNKVCFKGGKYLSRVLKEA